MGQKAQYHRDLMEHAYRCCQYAIGVSVEGFIHWVKTQNSAWYCTADVVGLKDGDAILNFGQRWNKPKGPAFAFDVTPTGPESAVIKGWLYDSERLDLYQNFVAKVVAVFGRGDGLPVEGETKQEAKAPRIPNRLRDKQKWRRCWALIEGQWQQGKDYKFICNWLLLMHAQDGLDYGPDVLADIVRAGEAGLLD